MFNKKISVFVLPFMVMSTLQATDPLFNDPFGDEIFKEMYQMQKDMDKVFERMQQQMEQRTQQWNVPALVSNSGQRSNQSFLEDKGTHYEYNTQIKEGEDKQIDIFIENGILHFKATVERKTKSEQSTIRSQQHYVNMVQRSETLPVDADATTLKSEYKNGVLILILQNTKNRTKPLTKEKEPVQIPQKPDKQKDKNNTIKIRVPHSSSHV